MKILVTVGTTVFDSLIEHVDSLAGSDKENEYTFQVASSRIKSKNGSYVSFVEDIESYYLNADLIITHAGAGTIYRLLELRKKIIVVPNLERVDKHQSDIAKYMEKHKHLLVSWELDNLLSKINEAKSYVPVYYSKVPFFKVDEIVLSIKDSLK
ncbi:hypothetical protein F7Q91_01575 [Vibrio chagasii]|uniref:Glycosyl transferase family 28 C-terminal domain-containing protein n=1 Tax=Vibrio chagasii TaxID=170679 RepID=A0A7V7NXT8_9VIBR|nr:PssE/Cps14G family polysaccharide biosynthesis glycosyltransferase [Vibrio chagasii]KAB0483018.1 hypothetical protein F7Q91_01575 [Vibrio chagasii]